MKCKWPDCSVVVDPPRKRCEEHAYRHRIRETMRQREAKHLVEIWQPRPCQACGNVFDPREGRDPKAPGMPRRTCPPCRVYKPKPIPPCARCGCTLHERRKHCSVCVEIHLNEQKERYRLKNKKPEVYCAVCGEVSKARLAVCGPCGRAARRRQASRLREFRERLFTTLVHTPEDVEFILALLDSPCEYCGSTAEITIEHRHPLIRGGSHTKDNLTAACKSCNSSKQDMTVEEWQENRLRI